MRDAKKARRRAQKKWLQTKLEVFKQIYNTTKRRVTSIVHQAKSMFYRSKISACDSSRQLFDVCGQLCGKTKSSPLPNTHPVSTLPQIFSNFFVNKVADIRHELDHLSATLSVQDPQPSPVSDTTSLSFFRLVTTDEVRKIILKSKPTTCDLDPIPTPLLTECLNDMLPAITQIMNQSLSTGVVPSSFKHAVVKPLLKKPSLDPNILKNYRPVSNLPFLSKILEKLVLSQLFEYLVSHSLLPPNQSAYRPSHSTETALLKVANDILLALDDGNLTVLTLLDLSAAFDTIDHTILYQVLQQHFGVCGIALDWFQNYLSDRTQTVILDEFKSSPANLSYGVPQGSVLGPILFIMYTKPLNTLISSHSIQNQSFADDSQLYTKCSPDNVNNTIENMQNCISDVKSWMTTHKLKLNDDKTEALLIHSTHSSLSVDLPSTIRVGRSDISFSSSARNLGFIITNTMSMEKHVSQTCRSAYAALRQISTIRTYIDINTAKTLVCALVLSRLDYANSLLAGCPKHLVDKLQKVQNSAARLVLKTKKRDHITPVLRNLHWLPIQARIQYKAIMLCHKFFLNKVPAYFSDILSVYHPNRPLRSSSDDRILRVPKVKKQHGERSFSRVGPTLWNTLPSEMRHTDSSSSFKRLLKTHLFVRFLPPTTDQN